MLKNELLLRVISGAGLAIFAFVWLFMASEEVFLIATLVLVIVGLYEYAQALMTKKIAISSFILYSTAIALMSAFWLYWKGLNDYGTIGLGLALLFLLMGAVLAPRPKSKILPWYLLSFGWIVLPFLSLILLRFDVLGQAGTSLLVFLIFTVTCNDICAYFGGKKFGKHKLAPSISPKKTIEGSLFGYLGALAGGSIAGVFIAGLKVDWKLVLIMLIVTFTSQIGDLVESKFKRYCGVKDSSNLIPGHGGFLDRYDAFLLTLPIFWVLVSTLGVTLQS